MNTPSRGGLSHRFHNRAAVSPGPNGRLVCAGAMACLVFTLGAAAADSSSAESQSGVKFVRAPEGAKTVTITLYGNDTGATRQSGYLSQRSPEAARETANLPGSIKDAYAGKDAFAYDLARLPDGTRYLAVVNEDKTIKFLNRGESQVWFARIYRVPSGDGKPEVLREGYQTMGNDVTVPIEIAVPGIGANKIQKLRTEIGYSLSGTGSGKPMIYTGRGSGLSVSGYQITSEGKLTLTISVPEDLKVTQDVQATLRFEPVTPGLPERTAAGKVTDYLTLGPARLVVTSIAPDFSQATLAVVAGSLEETMNEQLRLGAQMPSFAQVDLVSRKTVTREELLAKTKSGAPVFFVFGDLPAPRNPYGASYPGGPGMSASLAIPPAEIAEQLALGMKVRPVIVFVTRQINIEFLYADLRNKTPDYFILSDFADPLRTTFRLPSGPGSYYAPGYPTVREPCLRQLFNLPDRTLSIAAFTPNGKVVYVKADAGSDFLVSLSEAREACKQKR